MPKNLTDKQKRRQEEAREIGGSHAFDERGNFFPIDIGRPVPESFTIPAAKELGDGLKDQGRGFSWVYDQLKDNGLIGGFNELRRAAVGKVAGLAERVGAGFWLGVQDMVEKSNPAREIGRRLMSKVRKAKTIEITTDPDPLLVWMLDSGSNHCAVCPTYAGQVRRKSEWETAGIEPGPAVCEGGTRCNCALVVSP